MRWELEKLIRYIKETNDIGTIRLFASKYFKETWRQKLSRYNYDIDQLREFSDLIDWDAWYLSKGRDVKWYILCEFKDRSKYMKEDYEKFEKRYGVEFMRGHKRKINV